MEYWDLYNIDRVKLNKKHLRDGNERIKSGEYHIVVNIWIVNSKKEILLTQRHKNKTYPLKWECTGGSVLAGENSFAGALREVEEETGIKLTKENGKMIHSVTRKDDIKDIYLFFEDINIENAKLQEDEVINIKWVTKNKFNKMTENDEIAQPILYDMEILNKIIDWN